MENEKHEDSKSHSPSPAASFHDAVQGPPQPQKESRSKWARYFDIPQYGRLSGKVLNYSLSIIMGFAFLMFGYGKLLNWKTSL